MNLQSVFSQSDAIGKAVAILLLLMSIASWVVILWKTWMLRRAGGDVMRGVAAFWQAPTLDEAATRVAGFDRGQLVTPLIQATQLPAGDTLAAAGERAQQLTRTLRDALHAVMGRLQFGQVLLATIGSTAPFVGLLGTVWGIYHALIGIAGSGQISIERVAGPVGEALIMTAAGLAVAIPAVLAYNWFGRVIGRIEAELEGFARDLREMLK
ncbi:MAG TPA: MotA/TolQ/ExbB proton channel family protein [Ottowia sp.]|jgi:biopolymer transport protein ExbB|nr:MotA/TolQ/ExbB proton channel family protein [Ottowia sp.]HMT56954.1 MotA/TolQ/ExbB proton channel family protein [Ottowia sp.]HMT82742.1 MotA/TolQ/ExbB proton channel family protein [Ottowia sp.]HON31862.1 MotA/TolQ/ExbB proton channel family protein [Ottowia sp.]HRB11159.1 MotA/TolQ/ExbB proton channel family protein [Ottowia sp.]